MNLNFNANVSGNWADDLDLNSPQARMAWDMVIDFYTTMVDEEDGYGFEKGVTAEKLEEAIEMIALDMSDAIEETDDDDPAMDVYNDTLLRCETWKDNVDGMLPYMQYYIQELSRNTSWEPGL